MLISIPYGAIKRFIEHTSMHVYWLISIPYGAIKSILLAYTRLAIFSFQFLMVRLKDSILSSVYKIYVISIPYGAIKRKPSATFCIT